MRESDENDPVECFESAIQGLPKRLHSFGRIEPAPRLPRRFCPVQRKRDVLFCLESKRCRCPSRQRQSTCPGPPLRKTSIQSPDKGAHLDLKATTPQRRQRSQRSQRGAACPSQPSAWPARSLWLRQQRSPPQAIWLSRQLGGVPFAEGALAAVLDDLAARCEGMNGQASAQFGRERAVGGAPLGDTADTVSFGVVDGPMTERRNRTPECLRGPSVEVKSEHQPDSPRHITVSRCNPFRDKMDPPYTPGQDRTGDLQRARLTS